MGIESEDTSPQMTAASSTASASRPSVEAPWDDQCQAREALNRKHSEFPQIGDYWDEMFCPTAIVRMVDEHHVVVQRHFKKLTVTNTDPPPEIMLRAEFCEWLRYNTASMAHKTWADVTPRRFAPVGSSAPIGAGSMHTNSSAEPASPSPKEER